MMVLAKDAIKDINSLRAERDLRATYRTIIEPETIGWPEEFCAGVLLGQNVRLDHQFLPGHDIVVNATSEQDCSLVSFANKLSKLGQHDKALDHLYKEMYGLVRQQDFAQINEILGSTQVEECTLRVLLGILTTTLNWADNLPNRAAFFHKVERLVNDKGWNKPGLLNGLQ